MELNFQQAGQGEPILILHGLLGSLENWHTVSRQLAVHYSVFALDQRNHGRSPHDSEMSYELMAGDLEQFMRSRGLENANVLGHSMGGKTAMTFALSFPHRVKKLIVADIAPRAYLPRHNALFQGLLSVPPETFDTRSALEAALVPWVPDLATRRFLLKSVGRDAAGRLQWRIGLNEIYQAYSDLNAAIEPGRHFDRPALFLRGERSDYLTEQDLPAIRALFPAAQIRTVPAAGHLLHVDNRAAFVREVSEFLGSWAGT